MALYLLWMWCVFPSCMHKYIQQPPFLNSNRAIQIHFTHAIHFVSVKSHFIQTNNQKNCMKCYFLCIFVRPVFCMWCKNETAKIITPYFPICQMKRKWIKLWSEFFSVFCFAISLPYKRQCCSIIGKLCTHFYIDFILIALFPYCIQHFWIWTRQRVVLLMKRGDDGKETQWKIYQHQIYRINTLTFSNILMKSNTRYAIRITMIMFFCQMKNERMAIHQVFPLFAPFAHYTSLKTTEQMECLY